MQTQQNSKVWICRSNQAGPEHTEFLCIPTEAEVAPHREHLQQHQFAFSHDQVVASTLLLFQGFLPIIWELMFLLPLRTILIKVSGRQLWFFPRHFRGWPHCSHSDWSLPSAHLWQAQWSSQQWTAWQSRNHGGLAQVPSLDLSPAEVIYLPQSPLPVTSSATLTTLSLHWSLEKQAPSSPLPDLASCFWHKAHLCSLWLNSHKALRRCQDSISRRCWESHQAIEKGAEKNCNGETFVHPHTPPLFL